MTNCKPTRYELTYDDRGFIAQLELNVRNNIDRFADVGRWLDEQYCADVIWQRARAIAFNGMTKAEARKRLLPSLIEELAEPTITTLADRFQVAFRELLIEDRRPLRNMREPQRHQAAMRRLLIAWLHVDSKRESVNRITEFQDLVTVMDEDVLTAEHCGKRRKSRAPSKRRSPSWIDDEKDVPFHRAVWEFADGDALEGEAAEWLPRVRRAFDVLRADLEAIGVDMRPSGKDPLPDLLPLSDMAKAAYKILCDLPDGEGLQGKALVDALLAAGEVGASTNRLTRDVVNPLKPYGIENQNGYYIPRSRRPSGVAHNSR